MISRLRGIIIDKRPPMLTIDVNGVGYEVYASMNTFYVLPDIGKELILQIQTVVREDAFLLYGFYSLEEKHLFCELTKVNGVGPKMALAILSNMDPKAFVACIQQNDTVSLSKTPGVGKKTAERLVVEMKDRLSKWYDSLPQTEKTLALSSPVQDALSALMALGYKAQEAKRVVDAVKSDDLSSEDLIRLALQKI